MTTYVTPTSSTKSTLIVPDGTISQDYSIKFFGAGTVEYGEVLWENLLHLLETFADSTAPTNPTVGQLWYDSSSEKVKAYDGSGWRILGAPTVSASEPTDVNGGLWFDTVEDQLKLYVDGAWVSVAVKYLHKIDGGVVTGDTQVSTDGVFNGVSTISNVVCTTFSNNAVTNVTRIGTGSLSSVLNLNDGQDVIFTTTHPLLVSFNLTGTSPSSSIDFTDNGAPAISLSEAEVSVYGSVDTALQNTSGVAVGTTAGDAINRSQVDQLLSWISQPRYLKVDGTGTMVGELQGTTLRIESTGPRLYKRRLTGRTWGLQGYRGASTPDFVVGYQAGNTLVDVISVDRAANTITVNGVVTGAAPPTLNADGAPKDYVDASAASIRSSVDAPAIPVAFGKVRAEAGAFTLIQKEFNIMTAFRLYSDFYFYFDTPMPNANYSITLGPVVDRTNYLFNSSTNFKLWEAAVVSRWTGGFIVRLFEFEGSVGRYSALNMKISASANTNITFDFVVTAQ